MSQPAPHTSLTDRAASAWAHVHQLIAAGKGIAALAVIAAIVFLVLEARGAVKHAFETKAAQVAATTTPQTLPDAKLETHIFRPDQKPLKRRVFPLSKAGSGSPFPPGSAGAEAPPALGATPAVPHPEVTTSTAVSGPVANVYDPESPKDAAEIKHDYHIDLSKVFLASQRKEIKPLKYGAKAIFTIPAGGGDVDMKYLENVRPFFGFRPAFELGGGPNWNPSLPGPWTKQVGAHVYGAIEPLRAGDMRVKLSGKLKYEPELAKPLSTPIDLDFYWRWE